MTSREASPTDDVHVEIADNPGGRFYELRYGDQAAGLLVYETAGSRRVLTHTTIRDEYRGQGWSKLLIRFALDDLAAKGATITNYCPVVDRFIEANPGYEQLIDPDHPGNRGRSRG
ncbi:GNAT family N-acetyltransferase [Streptomyces chartreusis]|uniref:GNAT family N-acetyltransferase n=1 Tax=Streptomyces chartreusis TaxID=1969 RepID=UPI0033F3F9E9